MRKQMLVSLKKKHCLKDKQFFLFVLNHLTIEIFIL